jgi:hypothetical protein
MVIGDEGDEVLRREQAGSTQSHAQHTGARRAAHFSGVLIYACAYIHNTYTY